MGHCAAPAAAELVALATGRAAAATRPWKFLCAARRPCRCPMVTTHWRRWRGRRRQRGTGRGGSTGGSSAGRSAARLRGPAAAGQRGQAPGGGRATKVGADICMPYYLPPRRGAQENGGAIIATLLQLPWAPVRHAIWMGACKHDGSILCTGAMLHAAPWTAAELWEKAARPASFPPGGQQPAPKRARPQHTLAQALAALPPEKNPIQVCRLRSAPRHWGACCGQNCGQ